MAGNKDDYYETPPGGYDAHAPGDHARGHQPTAADGWHQGKDGRYYNKNGDVVVLRGGTDSAEITRERIAQQEQERLNDLNNKAHDRHSLFDNLPALIRYQMAKAQQQQTVNSEVQASLDKTAQSLAKGLNLRPKPSIGATNYTNADHQAMHDMVNKNVDASTVGAGGQSLVTAGNALTGLQQNGTVAMNNSEAQWGGKAGESARQWTTGLINYIGTQGVGIQLTGTQLSRQAEAASQAKNAMPDVVDYDPAAANQRLQTMRHDPIAMHAQAAQDAMLHDKAEAARQDAAHVMQTYDNTLGGSTTTPMFAKPPTMPGDGGGTNEGTDKNLWYKKGEGGDPNGNDTSEDKPVNTKVDTKKPVQPPPKVPTPPKRPVNKPTPPREPVEHPVQPPPVPRPPRQNPVRTPVGDPINDPDQRLPGEVDPSRSTGSNNGYAPVGGPINGGSDLGTDGLVGGFGGGIGGGSSGGDGGVRSGSGLGGGAKAGAGSGAGGAEGGARGGAAGASAAEAAAAKAGAAGKAGGMGMPAGKGKKKEEDEEHYAPSYLVEPDPDEVFGCDIKTAPPVIGA